MPIFINNRNESASVRRLSAFGYAGTSEMESMEDQRKRREEKDAVY